METLNTLKTGLNKPKTLKINLAPPPALNTKRQGRVAIARRNSGYDNTAFSGITPLACQADSKFIIQH